MIITGIDPGNAGAFAFIDVENNTIEIIDMPVFEFYTTKKRVQIDPYTISNILRERNIEHVYMEEVFSSPQMGVTSAFSFGNGKGMIEGVTAALQLPMTQVKPAAWKKAMKVPADKRAAVKRASQLLPAASGTFVGPRGGIIDGRAEAALLALYGAFELGYIISGKVELKG